MSKTWQDPTLVNWLDRIYGSKDTSSGSKRTTAIKEVFLEALRDSSLSNFRPDAIWTALGNEYLLSISGPSLKKFIKAIPPQAVQQSQPQQHHLAKAVSSPAAQEMIKALKSARQGWNRSSGVALERAIVENYNTALGNLTPEAALVSARDLDSHPLTRNASNRGSHKIGDNTTDDIYAATADGSGNTHIFGVVHAKSSVGDRLKQTLPRSEDLMDSGLLTVYYTLDPMGISRSPRGMLVNQAYVDSINHGRSQKNTPAGFHTVYVARNTGGRRNLASGARSAQINRIVDIDIRQTRDQFFKDIERARNTWLSNSGKISAKWS